MISRRRLLTGFVLAWAPLGAAVAQEYKAGKVYRVGYLGIGARRDALADSLLRACDCGASITRPVQPLATRT